MPKINYFRGESREFVYRCDPGSWGRKRHRLWGSRKHRSHRGRGGLTQNYREVFDDVAIRNWCPCCIDSYWQRDARSQNTRAENRRIVHRGFRAFNRRLIRALLSEYEEG